MRQAHHRLTVSTAGQGLYEVTPQVRDFAERHDVRQGLLTLFCRHTSASLLIQENADPDVQADLMAFFARIAPEGRGLYVHDAEGPDDMPAHIKSALLPVSLQIPVISGRMVLGTWQGIYLFEHRSRTHRREVMALLR